MKRIKPVTALLALAAIGLLAACAPRAAEIQAAYVSPQKYAGEDWTCEKLIDEAIFVGEALIRVSGTQDEAATRDAWSVFLIGLPVSGGGNKAEVARLKGEQEALRVAIRDKNCQRTSSSSSGS